MSSQGDFHRHLPLPSPPKLKTATMSWFGKKQPTRKEVMRETKRELRSGERSMDREVRDLERQEKKLEMEIKAVAKKGDRKSAGILAKQLVKLRSQKSRMLVGKTQMKGIGMQATAMNAQATVAGAMKSASKAMASMNAVVDPVALQATMNQFAQESEKFSLTQEMMDDTLDSMFDDEDEEETDLVVDSVFAELGLETAGQLGQVNAATSDFAAPEPAAAEPVNTAADDDLMARLAALSAP